MIDKIIHYCWFGGNPMPEKALKCIDSWKKYCPGYTIQRWDETNFDITCCEYVYQAYKEKKWAFVSDFARFWIIYNYGGVYFDTDVEIINGIDDILDKGPFLGCEVSESSNSDISPVNAGLGCAAAKGNSFYKEILDDYYNSYFMDGIGDTITVVERVTKHLIEHGYNSQIAKTGEIQMIEGIYIYPEEYFCPMDYHTGEIKCTHKTRTIHYYDASWYSEIDKCIYRINHFFYRKDKPNSICKKLLLLPLKIANRINKIGLKKTFYFYLNKVLNH